jgi:hypothetical protein
VPKASNGSIAIRGLYITRTGKVLINAVTVQVEFGPNHMSCNATNQELTLGS